MAVTPISGFLNTLEDIPFSPNASIKHQEFGGLWPGAFYPSPPPLAVGLYWIDIDNSANIRVIAHAEKVTASSADFRIDTWADTHVYGAATTWFQPPPNDPDFQIGQFSTLDDHVWFDPQPETTRYIAFDPPYAAPPRIVIWLNQLDMERNLDWNVKAFATNVTAAGFTININSGDETNLYAGTASWIAYPATKKRITSGSFSTTDIRPSTKPRLLNSGKINFPVGTFLGTPKVLMAFNGLNVDNIHNLRAKLYVDSVSKSGVNWHLDSWLDTVLYSGQASYIAFE
ncbi:hypothetical protein G7054_g6895 [Neopestalotiopsis clavispora]|nr:hypothetical protein G7054_g6895 [Neopestalotiopsis clavispora]